MIIVVIPRSVFCSKLGWIGCGSFGLERLLVTTSRLSKKIEVSRWYSRQWNRLLRLCQHVLGSDADKSSRAWDVSRKDSASTIGDWLRAIFNDWGYPECAIFDQNRSYQVRGLVSALRENVTSQVVSLPVSPWININVLRQIDFVRLDSGMFFEKHDYSEFDRVGQVDQHYAESLKDFFSLLDRPSPFEGHEVILGSIRYTHEWLSIRRRYISCRAAGEVLPVLSPARRRLLVIPSHRKNNSFWDEYLRTLHFIAQFEDYEILVKPHTRYGEGYEGLPASIRLVTDVDTSLLIDWSEIVLFWGSSVALEAFQKKRIMVNLDYLMVIGVSSQS